MIDQPIAATLAEQQPPPAYVEAQQTNRVFTDPPTQEENVAAAVGAPTSRRRLAAFFLLVLAYGLLIPGLYANLFTAWAGADIMGKKFNVLDMTKSSLGTMSHLAQGGHLWPALLICLFGVVVPFVKLAVLSCSFSLSPSTRSGFITGLRLASKWATVDSFVVMTLLAALCCNDNIKFDLHVGFYCFLAYCLLSTASAILLPSDEESVPRRTSQRLSFSISLASRRASDPAFLLCTVLVAVAWTAILLVPSLRLEVSTLKIDRQLSVLSLTGWLFRSWSLVPALTMVLFVVLAPLLHFIWAIGQHFGVALPPWLQAIEYWAMADVFAVALIVVQLAVGGVSEKMKISLMPVGLSLLAISELPTLTLMLKDMLRRGNRPELKPLVETTRTSNARAAV